MKRIALFSIIGLVLIIFTSYKVPSVNDQRKTLLQVIVQSLQVSHYVDVKFDDNYSEKAFNLYIKRLDYGKKFLTIEDYDKLKEYTFKIDNQVNELKFDFYELSILLLNKRIAQVESFYKELLSNPFDFSVDEYYETDEEKAIFAKNDAELKDNWRKYLKYQTIFRITEALSEQEKAKAKNDTTVVIKTIPQLEQEARQKVLTMMDEFFARLKKVREEDRFNLYLNCLVGTFDPHTEYFPPKLKQDFDINMSGRLEGIGATLQEKGDYIKVTRIVPGSASWKQGELKAGDIILKVAQGDNEPVDIVGMRLDDAVQLIRGKKGTEVKLTVKKVDGTVKVISIIRDVVILEESLAKSAIVTDSKLGVKTGYIKLPSFYTDFTKTGGNGCAADILAELRKLIAEDVDGIIFDLRDNGGGSLQDAVDIAGYFIPYGPVVQVRSRWGKAMILEDRASNVVYNGSLVFLINTLSASASEILAAALQDYNRAIVIGGTTFGKGTVQRFIELDQFIEGDVDAGKSFGSLKVTIQNFYRINGITTQFKGVTPDIKLPDIYEFAQIGEKDLDYPLPADNIQEANYSKWTPGLNYNYVKAQSNDRMKSNNYFKLISEDALFLKAQSDKSKFSLKLENYKKEMDEANRQSEKFKDIEKPIPTVNVKSLDADKKTIEQDTASQARNKAWHEEIIKDQYIFEAINVIRDLNKSK